MDQTIKVSAVIITYNEARNIGRCLKSLAPVVDEIIVLDSYSTDKTMEICVEFGAKLHQYPFLDYSDQKNRANALATHPWILSIDADECLSPELTHSLLVFKQGNQPLSDAFEMNRLTNYCGQWIRHCGWYPDRKTRLFDRSKATWGGPNPHEILVLDQDAKVSRLQGDLWHYSYYTVPEHLDRARKYADLATAAMVQEGKKGSWGQVIFSPIFKFLRNYILKLGFLDGKAGLTICKIAAMETYWKYRNTRG